MPPPAARGIPAFWDRVFHDVLGVVLHLATVLAVLCDESLRTAFFAKNPAAPSLLVGQEIVALVAHVLYLYLWYADEPLVGAPIRPGGRNAYKWAEYSVSATFGTIAALLLNGDDYPEWYWILFLAVAGATQQFIGYQIDLQGDAAPTDQDWVQFGIAAVLQLLEFVVVGAQDTPPPQVFVPYVIMWSLFGVHAWFRLKALAALNGVSAVAATQSETADDGAEPPTSAWADTDWVEACYGCLSWTAKLYVFWTAFAVRYDAERETDTQTAVAAAGGVVVLASLMLLAYASPTLARRLPCGNAAPARPLVAIY